MEDNKGKFIVPKPKNETAGNSTRGSKSVPKPEKNRNSSSIDNTKVVPKPVSKTKTETTIHKSPVIPKPKQAMSTGQDSVDVMRKELKAKHKYYLPVIEFLEGMYDEGERSISGINTFVKNSNDFNLNIKSTSNTSIEKAEALLSSMIDFLTFNLSSIKRIIYKALYNEILEEIKEDVESKALLNKCIAYIKKELKVIENISTVDELIEIIKNGDELQERILEYLEELIDGEEDEDEPEKPVREEKDTNENYYSGGGSSGFGFIKWIVILLLIGGIVGGIWYGIKAWIAPNWNGWVSCVGESCSSCMSDTKDPKDYYGTYSINIDNQTLTYEITEDGCIFTNDFGNRKEVSNWTYEYISVKDLYEKHSLTEDDEYINGYALVFYNEPYLGFIPDETFVNEIFYIVSTNPYKFVTHNHNYTLTKLK